MDSFMREFADYLASLAAPVTSVAVGTPGQEISSRRFVQDNPCQDIYSVAKLFTATAVGILWDRGMLHVQDHIADILPMPPHCDLRWHHVTVEMALQHTLGLPSGFLDIDVTPATSFGRDFLQHTFAEPLLFDPGTGYAYSDGAYYLMSRIVEAKCGMPLDTFLWQELFYPMGFLEAAWSRCPLGHAMGATGLYIRAEDMVKLGMLYLNDGLWEHKRILSRDWCDMAKARHYGMDGDADSNLLYKGGMRGQLLCMDFKNNRAIAVQSFGGDTGSILDWLRSHI